MPPSRRCFAVGDVQGCLTPLRQLLNALAFDPTQDHLIGMVAERALDMNLSPSRKTVPPT